MPSLLYYPRLLKDLSKFQCLLLLPLSNSSNYFIYDWQWKQGSTVWPCNHTCRDVCNMTEKITSINPTTASCKLLKTICLYPISLAKGVTNFISAFLPHLPFMLPNLLIYFIYLTYILLVLMKNFLFKDPWKKIWLLSPSS